MKHTLWRTLIAQSGPTQLVPVSQSRDAEVMAKLRDAAKRIYLAEADWLGNQVPNWQEPSIRAWLRSIAAEMRRTANLRGATR
jgi:hypothetical protein